MDLSDLLPGLAKMLEERLPAPLGYHAGTAIVIAAAFVVLLSPIALIAAIVAGVIVMFEWNPVEIEGHFAIHLLISLVTMILFVVFLTLANRWVTRRHTRWVDKVINENKELKQIFADYLDLSERIMHELAKRGGHDLDELRAEAARRDKR